MRIWSYNCFVPIVSFLFLGLASYGIIGLILNSWTLEKGSFHGIWPLNEKCGIVVLMVAQVMLLVVTLIGLGGFLCRSVVIWYIPGFLLLGTGVALIAFGGVSIRESTKDFRHDILMAFRKVNGSLAEEYLNWISGVQWEHDCCGIISYKDYLEFKFKGLPWQSVPQTCCQRDLKIPKPNCGLGILVPGKTVEEVEAVVLPNGCGSKMSQTQGATLQKLGTEMLAVGFMAVALAIFIYFGIFKIVAAEYAQLIEAEEPGSTDVENGLSQTTISSTTAANTSANSSIRNVAHRRIFRTRRHGGGESIVSFAVDLQNNNLNRRSSSASHSHSLPGGKGQRAGGPGKGRTQSPRQGQQLRQKPKGPHIGKGQTRRPDNLKGVTVCPRTSREKLEMLLHPRDNHSILSTTTYPSTQNFMTYFRQHQTGHPRAMDSDTNVATSSTPIRPQQRTLTHYSSLPHVHLPSPATVAKNGDSKSKEQKQRFPPEIVPSSGHGRLSKTVPPPPPPATSQTQHHHYYRIPSSSTSTAVAYSPDVTTVVNPPVFVDGKFPSVIEAVESCLDTIQEEGESGRSTIVQQSQHASERISIFEVFSEALGVSLEAVGNEATGGGTPEKFGSGMTSGSSECLVISEEVEGLEEKPMDLRNKIELEPIDALVYFQV